MLFDLQSPGRRSAVKVIFTVLAVIMGGGLVLFGVGGNTSGGLLDAFNNDNNTSQTDAFKKTVQRAEKAVNANPRSAPAWANLAKVRYQEARAGSGFDQTQGTFTAAGLKDLAKVESAWDRYVALAPKKQDADTALLMVQAFGPTGLGDYKKAVDAMETVISARPPAVGLYVQYASLAYLAGQTRKGDLAAKKAEQLAPKAQKETVKATIAQAKQAATQQGGSTSSSSGGSATVNGQTVPITSG